MGANSVAASGDTPNAATIIRGKIMSCLNQAVLDYIHIISLYYMFVNSFL